MLALLASNCSRFFVTAGFGLNQKYIAANLCINKNRPWMHCNGHCYFMKKIKQAAEQEKKQSREDCKNRFQEALPGCRMAIAFYPMVIIAAYSRQRIIQTFTSVSFIFHPPKTVPSFIA